MLDCTIFMIIMSWSSTTHDDELERVKSHSPSLGISVHWQEGQGGFRLDFAPWSYVA